MKAIQVRKFGAPEVLTVADVDDPTPGPGDAGISVRLAGVPFGDTIVRSGAYPIPLPYIPGLEVAGTVTRLGEGADDALLGATVVATTRGNTCGYAEHAVANIDDVFVVPDGLALESALAVFQAGAVAIAVADVTNAAAGETALVMAAAGRMGTLLVQELLRRGLTVIAAVGEPEKQAVPSSLGAHHVVVYGTPDWVGSVRALRTVDVVFDGVGGQLGGQALETLAEGRGRLALLGYASGAWTSVAPQMLARRGLTVTGATGKAVGLPRDRRQANVRAALQNAADDRFKVLPPTRYRLDDAAAAHTALENRGTAGAVVLAIEEEIS